MAGRYCPVSRGSLQWRRHLLWTALRMLGEKRAWGCHFNQSHLPVLGFFFLHLAEKLGIDRIAKYATAFGLGQKTGIDLPNEVAGVMPSEEWKIRNFKQKWFAGETISVGIGQGAVAFTPVQLLRAVSAI